MEKVLYRPKTLLIKPITHPENISIFKHIILFINEENNIERAIPDFNERFLDSKSSNIDKLNDNSKMAFFEVVDYFSIYDNEPVFEINLLEENKTNSISVSSSRCINGFSTSIEDVIYRSNAKTKEKKVC